MDIYIPFNECSNMEIYIISSASKSNRNYTKTLSTLNHKWYSHSDMNENRDYVST